MGLEHLIPSPDHISVHVVGYAMVAGQEETLVLQDVGVAGGNGTSVDSFGIGSCRRRDVRSNREKRGWTVPSRPSRMACGVW